MPGPNPSITLDRAIALARANEPIFAAAVANQRVAALDRSLAQAALLPDVTYHNQTLYTQPNGALNGGGPVGSQSAPRFIANNAVREYASAAVITETLGLRQVTAVSHAAAADAVATAELEIARRGLVSTVTNLFYGALAADRKVEVARQSSRRSRQLHDSDTAKGGCAGKRACRRGEGAAATTTTRP